MTIPELIDYVQMDLTMSCALPKILPDAEIQRLAMKDALPWFYEHYYPSVIKGYYLLPRELMNTEECTRYKYIQLPDDIQNVTWLYNMRSRSMFELGVNAPNLSVNLGVTNQPYLSSYATTVGELGVYKVIIDNFADMLNQLSLHTMKFDYNFGSKRLHILTDMKCDAIIEAYIKIPAEDMFEYDKFRRYVLALSKKQMGRMLTRYSFNLPGGVQINGEAILAEGEADLVQIRQEIKDESANSWFYAVKR